MEQNWTELLEKEYSDPASKQVVEAMRQRGKTDKEIYEFLDLQS